MRTSLAALLILGCLPAAFSKNPNAPLGSQDNPYPEDHPDTEDADDAVPYTGADALDENDPLAHYEDDGGSDLTEDHMRTLHSQLDHNGDGKVHHEELMKFAEKTRRAVVKKEIAGIFDEIESTKDGHLSFDEHMAEVAEFHTGDEEEKAQQKKAEIAKFRAADVNGDDKLELDELVHLMHPETHPEVLEVHCKEEMRKRDTDKDGRLNKKEWETAAPMGEHHPANADPDTHDPSADFDNLDENKDGYISMDELRHWESGRYHTHDAMKKLIDLADKDTDDHITEEELVAVAESIDGHDAHPHLLDWVFHEDL
jgi:Ca2+-binding EF-hand superfamily protein